jgi:hypothetical protein
MLRSSYRLKSVPASLNPVLLGTKPVPIRHQPLTLRMNLRSQSLIPVLPRLMLLRERMELPKIRLMVVNPRLLLVPIRLKAGSQGMELRSERLIPGRLRMEQVPPRM